MLCIPPPPFVLAVPPEKQAMALAAAPSLSHASELPLASLAPCADWMNRHGIFRTHAPSQVSHSAPRLDLRVSSDVRDLNVFVGVDLLFLDRLHHRSNSAALADGFRASAVGIVLTACCSAIFGS